jgi:beta-galactosidase
LQEQDPVTAKCDASGVAKLAIRVLSPRLWSAEIPNLYDLTVEVDGERVTQRIGIRQVTIKDAVLLLNGVPIKMAGMCRHDVSPSEGTAVGPETWRRDIELMKAANVNAIRTSHYPYGKGFYDLCDELGMYVVDELPFCWTPTDDEQMQPAFLQRARETVRRDKNHPCVLIWTIGIENKEGRNLQAVADLVKQLDDSRPRAVSWFGGAKYTTELSDSHYTTPPRIEESAKRAKQVGRPHIYLENPNDWEVRLGADAGCWDAWAPVLQRCWDVVAKEETLPGSFLWEWQDRAVADSSPVKQYYHFPETNIHLLKIKGIVDGFRNPRPWYYHVKMIYSPIRVGEKLNQSSDASFDVENRYSFTNLSQIKGKWQLLAAGKTIDSGEMKTDVAPLSKGKVSIASSHIAEAEALRVDFGDVVAHQFTLKSPKEEPMSAELPAGLAFPHFNLITRITGKDPGLWRKVTRFNAKLTDVKQAAQSLQANIVMDNEPSKVVGKLMAKYGNGNQFSYRVDWSGPKSQVQEIGWIFNMPKSADRFSWNRDALWTVYPDRHIGRPSGTARPDSMNVDYTKMSRPDAFDFNSTKYNCRWASLTDEAGKGVRVQFKPDDLHQCRGGASGDGYTLTVNKHVSPPDDLSSNVVRDLYMTLDPGDKIEGSFNVGSPGK